MAALRELPHAGGLMNYGPDLAQIYRRGATFVDMVTGTHEVAAPAPLLTDHPVAGEPRGEPSHNDSWWSSGRAGR